VVLGAADEAQPLKQWSWFNPACMWLDSGVNADTIGSLPSGRLVPDGSQ